MIGFALQAEKIARHLLGEPNRDLSTSAQLRYGSTGLAGRIGLQSAITFGDEATCADQLGLFGSNS